MDISYDSLGGKMPVVAIVQGSINDDPLSNEVGEKLRELNVEYEKFTISAHRNPDELREFCKTAKNKYKVIIAVAGLSAALPGIIASQTELPVIGVPAEVGPLKGIDALISMAQMPSGVPVATMGIGVNGARNSAILAKRILNLLTNKE